LYASESDLSDSDEGEEEVTATNSKRRGGDFAARIRLDDDEPMDLLSGAASRFTSEQRRSLFSLTMKEVTIIFCRCKRSPSI
jgi:ribosomal RNA-processing protein 12